MYIPVNVLGSTYKKVDSPLSASDTDRNKKQLKKKHSKQRSPSPEPKKKNKKGNQAVTSLADSFELIA